jgi:hypothetical protein
LLQRAKTTTTSCDNGLEDLGLEHIKGHQSLRSCSWRHGPGCENHLAGPKATAKQEKLGLGVAENRQTLERGCHGINVRLGYGSRVLD